MYAAMAYLLPAIVIAGLIFILFAGRRRRTDRGRVERPAPGSPDSPVFGTPKEPPKNPPRPPGDR